MAMPDRFPPYRHSEGPLVGMSQASDSHHYRPNIIPTRALIRRHTKLSGKLL